MLLYILYRGHRRPHSQSANATQSMPSQMQPPFDKPHYLLATVLSISGCSSHLPQNDGVLKEVFLDGLSQSCRHVKTVYEGHQSSGFINLDGSGMPTRDTHISLDIIANTLRECGAELKSVSQILED